MTRIYSVNLNTLTPMVHAVQVLNPQIKAKVVTWMMTVHLVTEWLSLHANVVGTLIRLNTVICYRVMMNGSTWDLSSMTTSRQLERTVILMRDGNSALKKIYTIRGCAQNFQLRTTCLWLMRITLIAWQICSNIYPFLKIFTHTVIQPGLSKLVLF